MRRRILWRYRILWRCRILWSCSIFGDRKKDGEFAYACPSRTHHANSLRRALVQEVDCTICLLGLDQLLSRLSHDNPKWPNFSCVQIDYDALYDKHCICVLYICIVQLVVIECTYFMYKSEKHFLRYKWNKMTQIKKAGFIIILDFNILFVVFIN